MGSAPSIFWPLTKNVGVARTPAARRRAVEQYSSANVIPKYEQFYREVIERTS